MLKDSETAYLGFLGQAYNFLTLAKDLAILNLQ